MTNTNALTKAVKESDRLARQSREVLSTAVGNAYSEGMSLRDISNITGISPATIRLLVSESGTAVRGHRPTTVPR